MSLNTVWDLEQAARDRTLAHICMDHQSYFQDTSTRGRLESLRYSTRLRHFNRDIEAYDSVPSITVCVDHRFGNDLNYDARCARWYDDQTFRVTDPGLFRRFMSREQMQLLHDFNLNKNICLKSANSCFENNRLLDYLEERGTTDLAFTGGYYNICVAHSIVQALNRPAFRAAVVTDAVQPSRTYKRKFVDRLGYAQTTHDLFDGRVMVTDALSVVTALRRAHAPIQT